MGDVRRVDFTSNVLLEYAYEHVILVLSYYCVLRYAYSMHIRIQRKYARGMHSNVCSLDIIFADGRQSNDEMISGYLLTYTS